MNRSVVLLVVVVFLLLCCHVSNIINNCIVTASDHDGSNNNNQTSLLILSSSSSKNHRGSDNLLDTCWNVKYIFQSIIESFSLSFATTVLVPRDWHTDNNHQHHHHQWHKQTKGLLGSSNITEKQQYQQQRRRLKRQKKLVAGDNFTHQYDINLGSNIARNMSRKEYLALQEKMVKQLRSNGFQDIVGHSKEAALLRHYQLRKKKKKRSAASNLYNRLRPGGHSSSISDNDDDKVSSSSSLISSSSRSMMDILFPGMKPELYQYNDPIYMITDQCRSSKTHVPYDFYDTIPTCSVPSNLKYFKRIKNRHSRQNLGSKLQGNILQPTPYIMKVGINTTSCTNMCETTYESYHIRFLKKLIHRLYRIHISLDQLPVLMRNSKYNYAIRGYPIGFKLNNEYYLYNHLKFIITYQTKKKKNNNKQIKKISLQRQLQRSEEYNQYNNKVTRKLQENEENEDIPDEADGDDLGKQDSIELEVEDKSNDYGGQEDLVEEDGAVGQTTTTTNNMMNDVSSRLENGVYITGFDVVPVSFDHQKAGTSSCSDHDSDTTTTTTIRSLINDPKTYKILRPDSSNDSNKNNKNNRKNSELYSSMNVQYTYEVQWIESDSSWEDRWDVYLLGSPDDDIHFFAIINSFMIVMFLTGAIAIIMIRTLRKDIMTYNEMVAISSSSTKTTKTSSSTSTTDTNNESMMMEETGWKLVHGDVFRPPSSNQYPMMLSCCIGSGIQIVGTGMLTLFVSLFKNIINPMKKGQTLTAIVSLFVLSGYMNGYVSARLYKFFTSSNTTLTLSNNNKTPGYGGIKNYSWKYNTLFSATALPGIFVGIYTILNIFLHIEGAVTAVSFLTLLTIFALWVCVSAPLVLIGSYYGYKCEIITVPTKTNLIERVVPSYDSMPWYLRPPISYLLGGVLPFGSVCIELFFIMSALWLHQIYYVMGFLLAVLLVLAATCAQVSIVMDYLQLCYEDYHWWWKSFFHCASAGLYLFIYSIWFLISRLQLVGILSIAIYITYMAMISLCFGLFCGSIGFICAFWFNRTIYGALHKVD